MMPQGPVPPTPPFDPNLIFMNDGGPHMVLLIVMAGLAATVGLKTRLAELEERLDFSERLPANGRQADQLPGRVHR